MAQEQGPKGLTRRRVLAGSVGAATVVATAVVAERSGLLGKLNQEQSQIAEITPNVDAVDRNLQEVGGDLFILCGDYLKDSRRKIDSTGNIVTIPEIGLTMTLTKGPLLSEVKIERAD